MNNKQYSVKLEIVAQVPSGIFSPITLPQVTKFEANQLTLEEAIEALEYQLEGLNATFIQEVTEEEGQAEESDNKDVTVEEAPQMHWDQDQGVGIGKIVELPEFPGLSIKSVVEEAREYDSEGRISKTTTTVKAGYCG